MKTIRQNLESYLFDHCLFPEEAKQAVEYMAAHKSQEAMNGRWDQDCAGYPEAMVRVLRITAKNFAAEWLKANKPKHFAIQILEA